MHPAHHGTPKYSLTSGRSGIRPRGFVPRPSTTGPCTNRQPHEAATPIASTMRTTHHPTGPGGARRARRVTHGLDGPQRRHRHRSAHVASLRASRTGSVSVRRLHLPAVAGPTTATTGAASADAGPTRRPARCVCRWGHFSLAINVPEIAKWGPNPMSTGASSRCRSHPTHRPKVEAFTKAPPGLSGWRMRSNWVFELERCVLRVR